MSEQTHIEIIPTEQISGKIITLRGEKVMPDIHIAEIYGVENRD